MGKWQIKALTAPFPLGCAHSHLLQKNCYSDVALNNFHDQGCGSRKPPLASLTLLCFLPISVLAIHIYEDIWIMWIELTKHHFENRQVERARGWDIGRWQRLKDLPHMKCESSRFGDVNPAKEVQIYDDSTLLFPSAGGEKSVVVITAYYWRDTMDTLSLKRN